MIDDRSATMTGKWTAGEGVKGYFGFGYVYANPDSDAKIVFETKAKKTGKHRIGILYGAHKNRGTKVPVLVTISEKSKSYEVDMTKAADSKEQIHALDDFDLKAGQKVTVEIATHGAGGMVHADAVQILPRSP